MTESVLDLLLWVAVVIASALPAYVAARRLRRLKSDVAAALTQSVDQSATAMRKVSDSIVNLQKQQQVLAQQMQVLAIAHNRMREDMRLLAARAAAEPEGETESAKARSPTLH